MALFTPWPYFITARAFDLQDIGRGNGGRMMPFGETLGWLMLYYNYGSPSAAFYISKGYAMWERTLARARNNFPPLSGGGNTEVFDKLKA